MAYTTKEQAANFLQICKDSVEPTDGENSFRIKKLKMVIKMRPGKCVYKWLDRYVQNTHNLDAAIDATFKESYGVDHIVPVIKIPKKSK